MKNLILAILICFTVGTTLLVGDFSSAKAEVAVKGGYILNYQDGEQKPIAIVDLVTWKGFSGGIWATDFDKLIGGLSYDWEAGLETSYKLATIKGIDLSIGYAIGARSPLAKEHEFIHGATLVAGSLKF